MYKRQLVALTDHEARWLVEHGVSEDKISVIPYGPILKPRDPSHEYGDIADLLSNRFILFLGRLVPSKGFNLLLNAFEKMSSEDPNTHLIMIGPTVDKNSAPKHQVHEQLNSPRVHLLQDISQTLKTAFLEEAAVLCVPSSSESLGGVYIEAMACNTPVIALDRAVSRCVIEHDSEGILVTNDEHSLVDGLRIILDNPQLADEMGQAGKKKVEELFAWPVVTKKMLGVYGLFDDSLSSEIKKVA